MVGRGAHINVYANKGSTQFGILKAIMEQSWKFPSRNICRIQAHFMLIRLCVCHAWKDALVVKTQHRA